MRESLFQRNVIKDIKKRMPGCIVMKTNPNYIQGIPDLLVLNKDRWGALEIKSSGKASIRPNQEYYISKMNDMSFAAFISPENKEAVLNELESTLQPN